MAAPTDFHQAISGEIFRQIANYLHGKPRKARPAPYDVRLFYEEDESDDTVAQPDISVICVEVLSPSNTAAEMVRKFNLYMRAGIREYWIVSSKSTTSP
jgi:Uma2 family endonuclease